MSTIVRVVWCRSVSSRVVWCGGSRFWRALRVVSEGSIGNHPAAAEPRFDGSAAQGRRGWLAAVAAAVVEVAEHSLEVEKPTDGERSADQYVVAVCEPGDAVRGSGFEHYYR